MCGPDPSRPGSPCGFPASEAHAACPSWTHSRAAIPGAALALAPASRLRSRSHGRRHVLASTHRLFRRALSRSRPAPAPPLRRLPFLLPAMPWKAGLALYPQEPCSAGAAPYMSAPPAQHGRWRGLNELPRPASSLAVLLPQPRVARVLGMRDHTKWFASLPSRSVLHTHGICPGPPGPLPSVHRESGRQELHLPRAQSRLQMSAGICVLHPAGTSRRSGSASDPLADRRYSVPRGFHGLVGMQCSPRTHTPCLPTLLCTLKPPECVCTHLPGPLHWCSQLPPSARPLPWPMSVLCCPEP